MAAIRFASRSRSEKPDCEVPFEHPLRLVRVAIDAPMAAQHQLGYRAPDGSPQRCAIGAAQMMRALLLQFLFAIRPNEQLIERIWRSTLFRWFVGVRLDEPKWNADVFAAYRRQILGQDSLRELLLKALSEAYRAGLLSAEAVTARYCELDQFGTEAPATITRSGKLLADSDEHPRAASAWHARSC